MLINAKIVMLGCLMAAASCSKDIGDCRYFPSNYKKIKAPLNKFSSVPLESVDIKKAVAKIRQCYPSKSYMGYNGELEIVDAKVNPRGGYYIVSEVVGINDLRLIFAVDVGGKVISGHQSSAM